MRWPMLNASAAFALAPTAAQAYGGGEDANGCHTNKKTGDYHCHGGGSSAGGGSPSPSRSVYSAPAPTPAPRRSQPKPLAAGAAGPATLVSVGDGDTIRVTGANGQKVTIRMDCIDALDRPGGERHTGHPGVEATAGYWAGRDQTVDSG
jgi:endonuclease YncB( thermonuclease family)